MGTDKGEGQYFDWLCRRVWQADEGNTYEDVLRLMFETEFVWVIGNDENRIGDARALRSKFHRRTHRADPVSFLEVLIALSERYGFLVSQKPRDLAWELMKNLKLNEYPDPMSGSEWHKVRDILEAVIWRTYAADGTGGFFPLEHPQEDQTVVEIWYQLAAYINEHRESFDL